MLATKKVDAAFFCIFLAYLLILGPTFLSAQDPADDRSLLDKAIPGELVQWQIGLYEPSTASESTIAKMASMETREFRIPLYREMAVVPDVTRMTWAQAKSALEHQGLAACCSCTDFLADDVVTHQQTAAGTEVPPGTSVSLCLVGRVPSLVGKSLGEAFEILEKKNGYSMKYRSTFTSDLTVTHQDPAPGSQLKRGESVQVDCLIKIPDVTGMSVSQAKKVLKEHHLEPQLRCAYLDSDRVLKQSICGKVVPAKTAVGLLPGVRVPNLVGRSRNQIEALLKETGIKAVAACKYIRTLNSGQHQQVEFVDQSVRPGEFLCRTRKLSVAAVQYYYQPEVEYIPYVPSCPPIQFGGDGCPGLQPGDSCPPPSCPQPSGPQLPSRGFSQPGFSQPGFTQSTPAGCPDCRSPICRCGG